MNKKNKNKGFSLIELIIAIAILVILTGLLAPQFMKYIEKSREAKDMQTLDAVYTAVQGAFADETAYLNFVKESGTGGKYAKLSGDGMALTALLEVKEDFDKEIADLLGTNKVVLTSKKSTATSSGASGSTTKQGVVMIKVTYTEEEIENGKVKTASGLEVSVYCGDADDGKEVGSLGIVGKQF